MQIKTMDFDEILKEIGEFGRYQKTIYFLLCLPVMFGAANSLSYVFTAGEQDYRCMVPECESSLNDELYPHWIINATPGKISNGNFIPENCFRYKVNESVMLPETCVAEKFNQNQKIRCNEWIFDTNEHTIVQEWTLTCSENIWKLALVGTLHFAGLVIGTFLSGFFADRYGRKILFIICIIFMALTGILQGFAWDYNSFLVFAFLNAVGTSGVYPLAFILGVEMVGPKHREMSSIVLNYFYAVGEASVGLAAWLLRDWQLLQFGLSVPPLFFVTYYWLIPESVRWLLARNKREKAEEIIKEVAKVNNRSLSVGLMSAFPKKGVSNTGSNKNTTQSAVAKSEILNATKGVLRSKRLCIRYTILLYIWAVNATVFYGLSLSSTSLSGNKYINFILVCLVEIPGYTLAWITLNKCGRRWSLSGSMILCSITLALGGFVAKNVQWALISLFLIGKLGITSSFAVIYTYTAEMMPTIIRSGGVGCMSTCARFGAMIAPFIPLLRIYLDNLPMLIFATISLSAGLMGLLLPETFGKNYLTRLKKRKQLGIRNDMRCV